METNLWEQAKRADITYKAIAIAKRRGKATPYSRKSSDESSIDDGKNYDFGGKGIIIEAKEEENYERQQGKMMLVNGGTSEKVFFNGEVVFERVGDTVTTFKLGEWQQILESLYQEKY